MTPMDTLVFRSKGVEHDRGIEPPLPRYKGGVITIIRIMRIDWFLGCPRVTRMEPLSVFIAYLCHQAYEGRQSLTSSGPSGGRTQISGVQA